ncbi:MAG: hypothetical protein P8182_11720 [Deltaproteobacteria bacterium]
MDRKPVGPKSQPAIHSFVAAHLGTARREQTVLVIDETEREVI